jgi:hypothetical protein
MIDALHLERCVSCFDHIRRASVPRAAGEHPKWQRELPTEFMNQVI